MATLGFKAQDNKTMPKESCRPLPRLRGQRAHVSALTQLVRQAGDSEFRRACPARPLARLSQDRVGTACRN
eukprot:136874-Rhodomonas_salina.1